ncbi:MAG: EthD family reductase [Sedimentitalea sp.]|nr:EthD family reductase [Sedimentitalea sp.]
MTMTLQVIYPATDGTSFDFDYYLGTHMPLVARHMGPHIDSTLVTRGVAEAPDGAPATHAVATLVFKDEAALKAGLAAAGPAVADIPNFTDTKPQMLIGEVIG